MEIRTYWGFLIYIYIFLNTYAHIHMGFSGGSALKNPPPMQEMQVQSLDQEDPLEKKTATHSSILAWRIPSTENSGRLQSMGSQRVGHALATKHTHTHTHTHVLATLHGMCNLSSLTKDQSHIPCIGSVQS